MLITTHPRAIQSHEYFWRTAANLPVEFILEEASPEGVFIHGSWNIGKKCSMNMRLFGKDLLDTFRSHLVTYLQHSGLTGSAVKFV